MIQDTGSAIITLSDGRQVSASVTLEEYQGKWSLCVMMMRPGSALGEKVYERHGDVRSLGE